MEMIAGGYYPGSDAHGLREALDRRFEWLPESPR